MYIHKLPSAVRFCYRSIFVHVVSDDGRAASKGKEVKWKMKRPSDEIRPRLELGWWRSVTDNATSLAIGK